MYKNYFLFEKQVKEIKPHLLGKVIQKIFTYQKNEIVIELANPEILYLFVNISTHLPYLLIQPGFNIRQPKYQLFQKIFNQTIYDIYIKPFDKKIIVELEKFKIIIVYYGVQPNFFIVDLKNNIVDTFKNGVMTESLPDGYAIDFRETDLDLSDFASAISVETYLKSKFTALNGTFINEILFRYNKNINNAQSNPVSLNKVLKSISQEIEKTHIYIYRQSNFPKKISLFRLYHLENLKNYTHQDFNSVNEAWQRFVSEENDRIKFDKLYKLCASAVKKKIDYLQKSLNHAELLKDLKERKSLAELKGNLLLIFKNQIQIEKKEVILENIFSSDLEKIKIRVNPNKSVSENAQIYFNKYKDLYKKRFAHSVKTKTLKQEKDVVSGLNTKINNIKDLSELKKIHKKLIDLNLLPSDTTSSDLPTQRQINFKHLILEPDWHVYIGKSGEKNDELTFKFANKHDYWFHAQGVPGSHVILKSKHKDQAPPYHILEQVAGIAAANSKAKHSSTVPVIYTQVRYVSRIRNAPKGTVNTRFEKTLFVEPLHIS